jgi:hypothetical protein
MVEGFNRNFGAETTRVQLLDFMARGVTGRLRGTNLERARRWSRSIGVDLDDLILKAKADNTFTSSQGFRDTMLQAAFNGSTQTQFLPNIARRPILWSTPTGRVMFQFKNFALGQARFLRDRVFAEAVHGNMRPLAYFAAIAPFAGEMVSNIKGVLQGKEPRDLQDLERVWSNILAVGGLGLASDIFTAGQFGRLEGAILGPTINDMTQMAEAFLRLDGEGAVKLVTRQPAYQGTRFLSTIGAFGVSEMAEYLSMMDEQNNKTNEAVGSLEELQLRSAGNK